MKMLVAVLGATGNTGKLIVRKLIEQKIPVRVLSRNVSKAKKMFGKDVEIIEADLVQVKDLGALMKGATHLLAAHGADHERIENAYELIDLGGIKKAIKCIPEGQKTHIIYMSSIYVERKNPPYEFPGRPLYWKRKTEQLIQKSGYPYTIVRPCWLTNDTGGKQGIKAEQGDTGDGKITRADVAEVMVQAMNFKTAKAKVFEIYNVPGDPVNDWEKFFSELKPDVKNS